MTIQEFSKKFDTHLFSFLEEKLKHYKKLLQDKDLETFISHIEDYTRGGKRLRPYGAYIGLMEAGKRTNPSDWMVMVSLELIHVLALVHDDIIDKADDRRGVVSLHTYAAQQASLVRGDRVHYGNSQAILVGDLVFSAAFEALSRAKASSFVQKTVHELLDEVILGQMIDVKLAYSETASKNLILRKSKYKTALYTFARPFEIGARLAKLSPKKQTELFQIGELLGVTYQIQDDLLDVFGNEKILQKQIMNDIREGQQTLLTDYFWNHANENQKQLFSQYFGNRFSSKEIPAIQNILREVGVEQYLRKELAKYFSKTKKAIDFSSLSKETQARLMVLVESLEKRSSL
jgi:geranylgeranyl diphosphate synthase type I